MRASLLVVLLALAACNKAADGAPSGGGGGGGGDQAYTLTPEQLSQGMQLCLGYEQRVCGCAASDASLKEACDFAHGRPEALKMYIKLLGGAEGAISTRERLELEAGAEKVISACVRADAELDPTKCRRDGKAGDGS